MIKEGVPHPHTQHRYGIYHGTHGRQLDGIPGGRRESGDFDKISADALERSTMAALLALAPLALQFGIRRAAVPTMRLEVSPTSQLAQLAEMTTLSIDTGDLDILEEYSATGLITDATTNPLFVSQAGLSGDARYIAFVDAAIEYAKANAEGAEAILELSMDRLAVELGLEIVKLVPGYVSTEVDIRASFDTEESVRRAKRIIAMYEAAGVDRSRVLVKLAGTWEGIAAARILEKEGITCNITLIFGAILARAPEPVTRPCSSFFLSLTFLCAATRRVCCCRPSHRRLYPGGSGRAGRCPTHLALSRPHQGLGGGQRRLAVVRACGGPRSRGGRAHVCLL
jgi:hypothetical protein